MRSLVILVILALLITAIPACATTYATWSMIWIGHDQGWWKGHSPEIPIDGTWKQIDWADNSQIDTLLDGMKAAGITVVIADLTNGWGWLDGRCQYIQSLCSKKGMKFCVSENSGGDPNSFENHAKDIWNKLAGPEAPNHEAYFNYHGKPLIVCYAVRDWFKTYTNSTTPFRNNFSLVWASGEDSNADKWGWQLEPWVGCVPSKDSMFVTASVRWNPGDGAMWRKSMAWLDYNFALTKKANPEYVIVGSYDESERNGWMVQKSPETDPGGQIRDKTGAISTSAHYNRVREWIKGKPSVISGGLLRDGAYKMINRENGRYLDVPVNPGAPGVYLAGSATQPKAPIGLFWLYHLGKNHYRVIALHSGLALEAPDMSGEDGVRVLQNWDSTDERQRWTLTRTKEGFFKLVNYATGKALTIDGGPAADSASTAPIATLCTPSVEPNQEWRIEPVITL